MVGNRNGLATKIVVHTLLILFCFICLVPLLLTISISLTDNQTLIRSGYQILPKKFSTEAYYIIFQEPQTLITGYKNSIIVTVVGTFFNLLITALIAYPLSRRSFHFKGIISGFVFFTMIFSGGLVPFYVLIVKYLGWKDTLLPLIIPAFAAPFNIFLLRVLFQDIPDSLIEAARIDGSSETKAFFRIVLPLSKPAMATLALMIILGYWNDVFNPILFLDSQKNFTIQMILQHMTDFINQIKTGGLMDATGEPIDPSTVPSDGVMFGLMVVSSLPMVFMFTALQKYFVKGITAGAVKG